MISNVMFQVYDGKTMDLIGMFVDCWCRYMRSFSFKRDTTKISLNWESFHLKVISRGKMQGLNLFEKKVKNSVEDNSMVYVKKVMK